MRCRHVATEDRFPCDCGEAHVQCSSCGEALDCDDHAEKVFLQRINPDKLTDFANQLRKEKKRK